MKNYLSLIKFSHTVFALPFAFIGFFLATHHFHYPFTWSILLLVILCMIFARSAAMAFNRYVDRDIDAQNERTAKREIPAGTIQAPAALAFVLINCLLFIGCTYLINPLCFYLSPIALAVILGYSYTKRFTALCHLVLGLGLSLAPLGAFLAVTGEFASLPILFSLIVLTWVSGFDIIYALQDTSFDRTQQLHSIPVLFGKSKALFISNILHLIAGGTLIWIGISSAFGLWYWIGAIIFLILLFYQHTIVSSTDLSRVNLAFFTTNGVASVLFAVFFLLEMLV